MGVDHGFLVLLTEVFCFNSKRERTRGFDLIAPDIIRAAVCFALESAIVGRGVARQWSLRNGSRRTGYYRPDGV